MTDRSFIVPVVASLVVHAGAFILIRTGAAPRQVAAILPDPGAVFVVPFDQPPPPEDPDPFDASAAKPSGPSLVEIPDSPQTTAPVAFQMEVQPPSPANVDLHATIPEVPDSFGPGGPGGPGHTGMSVIDSRFLDHEPRTRYQRKPMYPFAARHDGLGGRVIVEFIVDEAGRVNNARVVSSTNSAFDEPTLQAVSAWKFEPGLHAGRPVRFRMQVPVEYNLNNA